MLLVIFAPVMLIAAIIIRVVLGKPVIFCQQRPGYKGKIFKIYKFRSMLDSYDKSGRELTEEERIPRLGHLLRNYSIDELPELINVIKGEMSLVGPRPLMPRYLDLYTPEQARRHDVMPGITGWAQINGRNNISWEEKFQYDVWYVDNRSFLLDLQIIWLTLMKVIRKDGVAQDGEISVQEFTGTKESNDTIADN